MLPVPPSRVAAVVEDASGVLDAVRRPALVHFDLWDGNVLADAGALTGLVDGERYLYGDPLVDFVSPAQAQSAGDQKASPDCGKPSCE